MLKDNHAKLIADSARHFKEQFLNVRFLLPFFQFFFSVATTSYRRRSQTYRRDEWVGERVCECNSRIPILSPLLVLITVCFQSALFRSILLVRHSQSIHSWVLSFCNFWPIATSTLCSEFCRDCKEDKKDDKHLTIVSGLRAIKNKSFLCRNIF